MSHRTVLSCRLCLCVLKHHTGELLRGVSKQQAWCNKAGKISAPFCQKRICPKSYQFKGVRREVGTCPSNTRALKTALEEMGSLCGLGSTRSVLVPRSTRTGDSPPDPLVPAPPVTASSCCNFLCAFTEFLVLKVRQQTSLTEMRKRR